MLHRRFRPIGTARIERKSIVPSSNLFEGCSTRRWKYEAEGDKEDSDGDDDDDEEEESDECDDAGDDAGDGKDDAASKVPPPKYVRFSK